jgi:hypothetical protein
VAWVVLWDLPAYPERYAARLATSTASPYLLLADTLGGIRTTGMMSCNPAIADGSIHEFLCVIPRMME